MGDNPNKDYLEMSDEDFLQINSPETVKQEEGAQEETPAAANSENSEDPADPAAKPEDAKVADDPNADAVDAGAAKGTADSDSEDEPKGDEDGENGNEPSSPGSDDSAAAATTAQDVKDNKGKDRSKSTEAAKPGEGTEPKDPKNAPGKDDEKGKDGKKPEEQQPVDYEAFFKQVMTPFKANGREIQLKTPEEAIRLMQMGAGYGRKIQDLQPYLKVVRMLEKNDLLDENKLSFLIDVNQKNPDAVKKLIKESGIDPLDLNTEDNVDYRPKNHSVSDKEMAFHSALTDVQALPTGRETLRVINETWDQQSKSLLWESPEVLGVIQSQRENGIYDQIAAEIDRQKLLGTIPSHTPFLQAYKLAGDHLMATNSLKMTPAGQAPQIQPQPANPSNPSNGSEGGKPQPQVIATRPAQPKAQVQNSDKARAASPSSSTPRKADTVVNPLEMADDDFLKHFSGRL